jgi:hypothetical protein
MRPRLTHPTRAGQTHQPVIGQQLPHVAHLGLAPNETGELYRKIMGDNHAGCAQRRELNAQIGMAQLHHPLGAGQIAQLVRPQIGQPRIGRETVEDHVLGCA